jgi:hypothetical protein
MNLAKIVLKELNRQPLCRTEIELRTVRKAGSHVAFEGIFRYLVFMDFGFVVLITDSDYDSVLVTNQGFVVKKDLAAGGFLSTSHETTRFT